MKNPNREIQFKKHFSELASNFFSLAKTYCFLKHSENLLLHYSNLSVDGQQQFSQPIKRTMHQNKYLHLLFIAPTFSMLLIFGLEAKTNSKETWQKSFGLKMRGGSRCWRKLSIVRHKILLK